MKVFTIDKEGIIMWGTELKRLRWEDNEIPAVIKGSYPSLTIPVILPNYLSPIWRTLDDVEIIEFPFMVYASVGVTKKGNTKLVWDDEDKDPNNAIVIVTSYKPEIAGLEIIKQVKDEDNLYHTLGIAKSKRDFVISFGKINRVYRYENQNLQEVKIYVSKR